MGDLHSQQGLYHRRAEQLVAQREPDIDHHRVRRRLPQRYSGRTRGGAGGGARQRARASRAGAGKRVQELRGQRDGVRAEGVPGQPFRPRAGPQRAGAGAGNAAEGARHPDVTVADGHPHPLPAVHRTAAGLTSWPGAGRGPWRERHASCRDEAARRWRMSAWRRRAAAGRVSAILSGQSTQGTAPMKRLTVLALAVLAAAAHAQIEPAPDRRPGEGDGPYPQLILRGVTLVNGTGAPTTGPVDIVIRGNHIERIANVGYPGVAIDPAHRPKLEEGGREMDLSGHYVLPGFVDMHGHIGGREQG